MPKNDGVWSLTRILKREKHGKKGNHVTDGLVLGSLKHGISIDWSPMNLYLHIGNLAGPARDRRSHVLHVKEAKSLGYSLLLAAAELELALERNAAAMKERDREQKARQRRRYGGV